MGFRAFASKMSQQKFGKFSGMLLWQWKTHKKNGSYMIELNARIREYFSPRVFAKIVANCNLCSLESLRNISVFLKISKYKTNGIFFSAKSLHFLTFCFDIVPLHNSQNNHICHVRYIFLGLNMASDKQLNKTNIKNVETKSKVFTV